MSDQHKEDEDIRAALERIGRVLFVMSGKGGVGKSTVAVNLAVGLALRGFRVGLLDTDFHGPDTLKMLGIEHEKVYHEDGYFVPIMYDEGLKVMSMAGLLEDTDSAVIWRGPIKIGVIRQFIGLTAWGDLDFLVVDAPPGTGDEPLTVAQLIPGAEAVVVTTPQEVSLLDVRKSISFCRKVGLSFAGIIENMSGFVCPHCGTRTDIFGSGGGRRLADTSNLPFLGEIPLDPSVVLGGDRGTPSVHERMQDIIEKILQTRGAPVV